MPSFSQKISSMVDAYQHSKSSPAYRELRIKYKTLKSTNKELVHLLAEMVANMRVVGVESTPPPVARTYKPKRAKLRRGASLEESDAEPVVIIKDEPVYSTESTCKKTLTKMGESNEMTHVQKKYETVQVVEDESDDGDYIEIMDDESVGSLVDLVEDMAIQEEEPAKDSEVEMIVEAETQETDAQETEEEEDEETDEVIVEEEVAEEAQDTEEVEEVVEEAQETEEVVVEEEEEVVEETEEAEEEEEAGVYEVEINGVRYYTTNEQNGTVYAVAEDDDVGDEIGRFVNGKLELSA